MTALQLMYQECRKNGCGHDGALHKLAYQLGLDRSSVARTLASAEREDAKRHGADAHGARVTYPTAR